MRRINQADKIRKFLLDNLQNHRTDIARFTATQFDVSREAVARQLRALAKTGLITVTGEKKGRKYDLTTLNSHGISYRNHNKLEEHVVWSKDVSPNLHGLSENVREICEYGFSEIFNNAIEHSESPIIRVSIKQNAIVCELRVTDWGVGIFNKIQKSLNLPDPRYAILELSKGKLTTDPSHHTGEGIFFTSRMFDEFRILSGDLFFSSAGDENDWLLESDSFEKDILGTHVALVIRLDSSRKKKDVFDLYSSEATGYDFSRTHVPVKLARYGNEQLISRSQARRILARFERFREVILDFRDVATIGHSFADEIFRVFKGEHPTVEVFAINTTPEIDSAIAKARRASLLVPPNDSQTA